MCLKDSATKKGKGKSIVYETDEEIKALKGWVEV